MAEAASAALPAVEDVRCPSFFFLSLVIYAVPVHFGCANVTAAFDEGEGPSSGKPREGFVFSVLVHVWLHDRSHLERSVTTSYFFRTLCRSYLVVAVL
jgi:hypothetical protein